MGQLFCDVDDDNIEYVYNTAVFKEMAFCYKGAGGDLLRRWLVNKMFMAKINDAPTRRSEQLARDAENADNAQEASHQEIPTASDDQKDSFIDFMEGLAKQEDSDRNQGGNSVNYLEELAKLVEKHEKVAEDSASVAVSPSRKRKATTCAEYEIEAKRRR
ncbi:unnamed protein product [Caenorhabditis angaria]|uniref:Uncharacterized protein n=1 Tax=Caenorhabditis angaria TaxID=860376 RepID=A0A9P1N8Y7_9PELO|nr:unnamed protein product [Caenorhabditis angaria]